MKIVNHIFNGLQILTIASIFLAVGCVSLEKRLAKEESNAEIFYRSNPAKLAELCHDEFPVSEIQYIPGDTIVKYHSIVHPGVVIPCPNPTPENPKPSVQCPDCIEKIKEVFRTDTVKVKDTQQIYLYQTELKKVNEENDSMESKINDLETGRNNWRWAFIVLAIAAGLFVVFKIIK